MQFSPSPVFIILCIVACAYTGYNFYRAWFELDDMRSFLQENLDQMSEKSPFRKFFMHRINYPGWAWETRIVSLINFILMIAITLFVIYAYFH